MCSSDLNFGIRKRLLEYDDVMNSQRSVIYTRRRHALMGERIGLDVMNTLYDTTTALVEQAADSGDFEGFKLELFRTFALECPVSEATFRETKTDQLIDEVFDAVLKQYKRRTERMAQVADPVIKQVFENQGAMYENIMIPITDGKRMYNISCNLKSGELRFARSTRVRQGTGNGTRKRDPLNRQHGTQSKIGFRRYTDSP